MEKKPRAKAKPKEKLDSNGVANNRGLEKTVEGRVTSNKMTKTIVVTVSTKKRHAKYGKYINMSKKYMAHDEKNDCQIGDRVLIVETRPLSRHKRWRVREVLERAV